MRKHLQMGAAAAIVLAAITLGHAWAGEQVPGPPAGAGAEVAPTYEGRAIASPSQLGPAIPAPDDDGSDPISGPPSPPPPD